MAPDLFTGSSNRPGQSHTCGEEGGSSAATPSAHDTVGAGAVQQRAVPQQQQQQQRSGSAQRVMGGAQEEKQVMPSAAAAPITAAGAAAAVVGAGSAGDDGHAEDGSAEAAAASSPHKRSGGGTHGRQGDAWQVMGSSDSAGVAAIKSAAFAVGPHPMLEQDTSSDEQEQQQQEWQRVPLLGSGPQQDDSTQQEQQQELQQQQWQRVPLLGSELQQDEPLQQQQQQQKERQQQEEGERVGVGQQLLQQMSSEDELGMRRHSSMEVDAGAAGMDSSSSGMEGQDEQGGLPEDYEEEEYVEREGQLSDEDEDLLGSPPVYCINCTGRMRSGQCEDCGHVQQDDASIFFPEQPCGPESAASIAAAAAVKAHDLQQRRGIALVWDERMELHEEGKVCPHPERPDRVRAVMSRILASNLAEQCTRVECPEATLEALAAVHSGELISFVRSLAQERGPSEEPPELRMTSDMYANAHTFHCARLAAGGAAEVACRVAQGQAAHGAAIVRPPGHHAESAMAMGFCFFNSAAVAARAAQGVGARRVLILDWDIHHGNGTQHIFEDDPTVLYMSLHRHDFGTFYPGTGAAHEVGKGPGRGFTVNVAWDCGGIQNGDYLAAFTQLLLPVAYEFAPDLIIVSAGFDAAEGDPIGGCRLTSECFAHMTALLKAVAPLALVLEGGYNLRATAAATEACLRALLGQQPPPLPGPKHPTLAGMRAIRTALQVQAAHWVCARTALAIAASYSAPPPGVGALLGPQDYGRFGSAMEDEEEEEEEDEGMGEGESGDGEGSGERGWESESEEDGDGGARTGGAPGERAAGERDGGGMGVSSGKASMVVPPQPPHPAAARARAHGSGSVHRSPKAARRRARTEQGGAKRSAITHMLSKIRKRAVRAFWRRHAARVHAARAAAAAAAGGGAAKV